jgi:hypothetical protein
VAIFIKKSCTNEKHRKRVDDNHCFFTAGFVSDGVIGLDQPEPAADVQLPDDFQNFAA